MSGNEGAGALRAVLLCFLLGQSMLASFAAAARDDAYRGELLERARAERLAETPEWRALLHYKPRRWSAGLESQVDEESFFVSPVGKTDPRAELDATLAGFFEMDASDADNSVQCRYPARYHWLDQRLHFDAERLPTPACGRFHRWFEGLNPGRLTLVFPAAYLNNPASMFGHTLLRVDAPGQDERTRLLASTIGFAAETGHQHGLPYAFKGLFGMYHGRYSITPYYVAVKEYGDVEYRDIWEFGLDLTAGEVHQLVRHAWELRPAYFDYYFLDENCSYHLLSLLDAARPELRLTDRFSWWTVPSEAVRAVREAGLVTEVRFRPARTTVLRQRARLLDSRLHLLASSLAAGEVAVDADDLARLDPRDQAMVLELALDSAVIRHSSRFGRGMTDDGTVAELLRARSLVSAPGQTPVVPAPEVRPGEGHRPARAGIGYGFEDRRQFAEVTAGPGYHDLLDPQGGFIRGAQLNVLNTAVRFYPEQGRVELERIDVIDIMSLSPWRRLMRPLSWKADLGVGRKRITSSDRPLMGQVHGGIGLGHDLSENTLIFAFAEGAMELSDRFAYVAAPGIGPVIGVVHDVSPHWRTVLMFRDQMFFLHEWRNDYDIALRNRVALGRQGALGIDLTWQREFGGAFATGRCYWQIYF